MKKIKILQNAYEGYITFNKKGEKIPYYLYKKGEIHIVTEDRARDLTKVRRIIGENCQVIEFQYAEVIEDLGLHFGNSKHIYIKNGLSKVTN